MRHLLAAAIIVCGGLFVGVVHAADEDEDEAPPAKTAQAARTAKAAPADSADSADSADDADDDDGDASGGRDANWPARSGIHHEGDYGGVTPEHTKNPEGRAHGRRTRGSSGRLLVTWVGFQAKEGGAARVFVQLSADAPYEQKLVGDKLVLFVTGARLGERNHGRFIDTSFFDTAVARVEGKNVPARRGSKAGVELTIHFKKGAAKLPDVKSETGPDGHRYLFLDFAP